MTGPKTNEGATKVGQRVGTRAQVKFVRSSAYKAREVLNLIRGMDVRTADETLQLVERDIAIVIRKCLASAVANAVNNDQQSADELFITACFADEGATLKRFRPRARGRAFRIRKRTTHITIIVARMADSKLEQLRKNEAAKPASVRGRRGAQSAASARRDRVARSRQAAAPAHDHDHDHDHDHGDAAESTASTTAATLVDTTATEDVEAGSGELHPFGEGSHAPLDDGSQPEGYDIKGNAQSMLYHTPDSRYYKATKAEAWFATEEAAEAAGFSKPGSQAADDEGDK
jgi:large subunit ribosomal protein L22